MFQELRLRRAAASGVVILLHILLLLVLLNALKPAAERIGSLREIVVHILPTPEEEERARRSKAQLPTPEFLAPPSPRAITLPTILEGAPLPAPQAQPQGDIRALGRYLTNCTEQEFERLSAKERAHCIMNKWQGKDNEPSLVLGPTKPSPFDVTVTGQRPDTGPPVQPCDPGTPHANYGIGCMKFPKQQSDPGLLRH